MPTVARQHAVRGARTHAGSRTHADAHALTCQAVDNTGVIAHWRAAYLPALRAPTASAGRRWCGPSTRVWRSADSCICAVCWRAAYREVMFFAPLPAGEDPAPGGVPALPPWSGAPAPGTGAGLALWRAAGRRAAT